MKLEKISINNYKSIDHIEFPITEINKSYTYSLIGINESGKSSFLKAISLIDNEDINYPLDFFNSSKSVIIELLYKIEPSELSELRKKLVKEYKFPNNIAENVDVSSVIIRAEYEPIVDTARNISEFITFKKDTFTDYYLKDNIPTQKPKEENDFEVLSLQDFFQTFLNNYFWEISHNVVLWKSSPQYLILEDIDLISFAKTPKEISVPLFNCFILSGIKEDEIKNEIDKLSSASPVMINSLQSKLSELITEHINRVWPEHPISITFQINNNKISLLIEDNGVKWQPKTTSQRSDGFKQFISFLLTISVENHNSELSDTILLIDEPETHLHPPAQLNLLKELIKITSNKNNNILFFATHSNYLIDKNNINRNYKVSKIKNHKTEIKNIEKQKSSYAEVNYEVFDILTTDYHNELYGVIEAKDKSKLEALKKEKKWINEKTGKNYDVSLAMYIRHSIHHPENTSNKDYTEEELKKSIETLRKLI